MNQKCRSLEFCAIKWEFDLSNINMKEYDKLDDGKTDSENQTTSSSSPNKASKNEKPSIQKKDDQIGEGRSKTACCTIF